jgi:hypothetical protein
MKKITQINVQDLKADGWTYISIKGGPKERGYAYGKLIEKDMKEVKRVLDFIIYTDFGVKWDFFIDAARKYFTPKIKEKFPEFYEEMVGFAEGSKMSIDEVIAWNNYFTLTESWWANMPEEETIAVKGTTVSNIGASREGGGAQERCSAFIAVGDWTKDGKIVCAHNNFSNFVDGQFARFVVDLKPTKGNRILMMGFPGWIWSGTDFFITSAGIIGTETTIGGFFAYQNNVPISTDPFFGKGYTVQSITITEGCNLIFTPQFAVSNYSTYPGLNFKISLYKSTTTPGLSTFIASTISTGTVQNSSVQIYNTSFTVSNSDLEVGIIYYIQIQVTSLGSPFASFPSGGPVIITGGSMGLKVAQYPTFITPFSSSGYNTIWGYGNKVTHPYIITSSKSQLTDYFENPEIIMKSVDESGFNQIQLPWSIKIGDEFRFEGREDFSFMVKNIFSLNFEYFFIFSCF